jgi:hypothetical protein
MTLVVNCVVGGAVVIWVACGRVVVMTSVVVNDVTLVPAGKDVMEVVM